MNNNTYPRLWIQANAQVNVEQNLMPGCQAEDKAHRRVLVATQNTLLGDVLEILLAEVFIPHIYRLMDTHPDSVLQGVDQYQPQVVVLEEGLVDDSLLPRLSQSQARGRRRIILVHPQKNSVQVFGEFQVHLTQSADLFALIANEVDYPS